MKAIVTSIALQLMALAAGYADSPAPPVPLVFTPEYQSDVFFTMVPAKRGRNFEVTRQPYGVAYRLSEDGKIREIYRTSGWYSFKVFVSEDARYLVQMGPWAIGDRPDVNDLAVAFHRDGKLVRSYSTADLVSDPEAVSRTVSHYDWMEPNHRSDLTSAQLAELRPKLSYENQFTLHTIEGYTFVFDATTGEIIEKKKRKG